MDEGGPEPRGQGTVKPADRSRGRSGLETGRRAPRRQTGSSPFPVTLAPSDKARVSLGLSSPVLSFSLCPSSVSISVSSSHSLPLSLFSRAESPARGPRERGKYVGCAVGPSARRPHFLGAEATRWGETVGQGRWARQAGGAAFPGRTAAAGIWGAGARVLVAGSPSPPCRPPGSTP